MTVFAFDKDEGLSEHTAPFDAAFYLLEGEAEIRIDGKPHSVKEGEMIIKKERSYETDFMDYSFPGHGHSVGLDLYARFLSGGRPE